MENWKWKLDIVVNIIWISLDYESSFEFLVFFMESN